MNAPAARSGPGSPIGRLGFIAGQVVQELGYDDDIDHEWRADLVDVVGAELEYDDFTGVADVAAGAARVRASIPREPSTPAPTGAPSA